MTYFQVKMVGAFSFIIGYYTSENDAKIVSNLFKLIYKKIFPSDFHVHVLRQDDYLTVDTFLHYLAIEQSKQIIHIPVHLTELDYYAEISRILLLKSYFDMVFISQK
jgi:hypothetical protein